MTFHPVLRDPPEPRRGRRKGASRNNWRNQEARDLAFSNPGRWVLVSPCISRGSGSNFSKQFEVRYHFIDDTFSELYIRYVEETPDE